MHLVGPSVQITAALQPAVDSLQTSCLKIRQRLLRKHLPISLKPRCGPRKHLRQRDYRRPRVHANHAVRWAGQIAPPTWIQAQLRRRARSAQHQPRGSHLPSGVRNQHTARHVPQLHRPQRGCNPQHLARLPRRLRHPRVTRARRLQAISLQIPWTDWLQLNTAAHQRLQGGLLASQRPWTGGGTPSSVLELPVPRAVSHAGLLQAHQAPRVAARWCNDHINSHVQRRS
mmetsp:Transcript_78546/g.179742  ORF Transcript_78546/g.179742 Transcript_78546/m.179742 type:complete len:229 (+) Transcript_78546:948-1634(+)